MQFDKNQHFEKSRESGEKQKTFIVVCQTLKYEMHD